MIETMKSVTLVSLARNKDEMLHSLRKAGILHIRELVPSCAQSAAISQEIHQLMSLSNAVSDEAGKGARDAVQEKLDGPAFKSLVQSLEKALQDRKAASEERLRLSGELSRVEAWGEFDPQAVAELAECGFALDFYTVDERVLDSLRGDESVCFITLGEISRMKAIATVNSKLPDDSFFLSSSMPIKAYIFSLLPPVKSFKWTISTRPAYLRIYSAGFSPPTFTQQVSIWVESRSAGTSL